MLGAFAVGALTALATGLGAIPVALLGARAATIRPALLGVAAGVMVVAAIWGLLLPALDEGSAVAVAAGLVAGITFLGVTRLRLRHLLPSAGREGRLSALVFIVLLVHSLPEGLALGAAMAGASGGLALFVVIAIGVQNIPEGTSVAIPLQAAGRSPWQLFWAAVATSLPQPIGAPIAYGLVDTVEALLPASFAFAAGAMLALVVVEIAPEAWSGSARQTVAGTLAGAAGMLALSAALGV
jgi:ZIP family zinc transporter